VTLGENVKHTKAIYPGSFDPVTFGHLDIIKRSRTLFDQVVVAVATNVQKEPFLDIEDRLALLRDVTAGMNGIEITSFSGLLVDFARTISAKIAIRGLRAVSDFEFELQMALTNRSLDPDLETVFLMPKGRYIFLSSRLIKELWLLGGSVSKFVPGPVAEYLQQKAERAPAS
jgi:pantetheine-phosphate adenylyltransferase